MHGHPSLLHPSTTSEDNQGDCCPLPAASDGIPQVPRKRGRPCRPKQGMKMLLAYRYAIY